jgi:hypothetical protein
MRVCPTLLRRTLRAGGAALGLAVWVSAGALPPQAPTGVRAFRQDAQAARIEWDYAGHSLGYRLYAAVDEAPPVFHQENEEPLHQNFVVWDAPRGQGRQFRFYVTAVDSSGRESAPSKPVRVSLGPVP